MADADKPRGLVPGQPAAVAEMAAYQTGAVVSREVMKSPRGTVTVFAFDAGEGLSEHTTPFDALAHVLDGEAEITIDGAAHRVRAGEAILMPGGHPHALRAVARFKMLLTMIRT